MLTTIPTDVFLDILNQLKQDCRNPHDANPILRLASTSRHLRNVIDSWAGTAMDVKHDLEITEYLLWTSTTPHRQRYLFYVDELEEYVSFVQIEHVICRRYLQIYKYVKHVKRGNLPKYRASV